MNKLNISHVAFATIFLFFISAVASLVGTPFMYLELKLFREVEPVLWIEGCASFIVLIASLFIFFRVVRKKLTISYIDTDQILSYTIYTVLLHVGSQLVDYWIREQAIEGQMSLAPQQMSAYFEFRYWLSLAYICAYTLALGGLFIRLMNNEQPADHSSIDQP